MKLISAMLVVKDINQSVDFYETVLGLKIISDFGANKTLSGGLALQTLDSYCLLYTSPSPRDYAASRMPSSA